MVFEFVQGEFNCELVHSELSSLCVKEKIKIENWILKSQRRIFLCIAGVMEASLSNVSNPSSLEKIFDKEMLWKLYIMTDMVQEMYEDKRESIILQEQFIAMKEEKQELLEKMHEMETQLHGAKETLAKYVHEQEVC